MNENDNENDPDIKYTLGDIKRIFAERVVMHPTQTSLKAGVVCEWVFTYPNGNILANVECSFPINPEHADYAIGCEVCREKIMYKLWEICGQYSLATGEKL